MNEVHTVWKGAIRFGLVNIPVRMFAATEEKRVRFRQLHDKCHTPIRYRRICPHCEQEVDLDNIVKGYEIEEGRFVTFTEDELQAALPDTDKAIDIVDFVALRDIDPVYFKKSYYLSPQDTGERAYLLLQQAMEETNKIGIAQMTIRAKQSLAAIRVYDGILVLEAIFYPDEVRPVSEVPGIPEATALPEKEMAMAQQLIEQLVTPFSPGKYKDDYRDAMIKLINQKAAGEDVKKAPPARPHKVVDLMEALQESLEQTKEKRERA